MTAYLTHEIRNSLGVIYGYSKTLKSEKEKVDKVNQEINFLSAMMESFLNFSKPVTVNKNEKIDLVDLINRISAEKNIKIKLNKNKIEIENDQTLVNSIFSNLILNSREAGATEINIDFQGKVDLEIIFSDNGKGINNKIKEKIWYPFFTTKRKGTGMGLAIVRKIINTLNGEISLLKSDKNGTSFKIIFYT